MAKILLVEDDKSLREIYGVRLLAEGYDIVSAGDGEEALAMAIKDRPDLIISDVMMPKISGFDMLDILRSTSETKGIKVIMMTALSSEDQRARGEALGADRYLVKSQVGIEDVVRTVHDVLGDTPAASKVNVFSTPTPTTTPTPAAAPAAPAPLPPAPTAPAAPTLPPVPPAPILPPAPVEPAAPVVTTPSPAPATDMNAQRQAAPLTPPDRPAAPVAPSTPVEAAPAAPVLPPVPPAPVAPVEAAPAPAPYAPPTAPAAPIAPPSVAAPQYISVPPTTEPSTLPEPTAPFSSNPPASLGERILQPLEPQGPVVDMNALINQELNGGAGQPQVPPQGPPLPPTPPAI